MDEGIHVLHVDDDPEFADVAAVLERESGRFEVETVTSPADGLARLEGGDVDCVVADYDLPGATGIEFLRSVREADPDLPFVLFTGVGNEEVAAEAISAGVTDYLRKQEVTERYTELRDRIVTAVETYREKGELATTRKQYEKLVEGNFVGIYIIQDGAFVYVNPRLAEIHGYDREALVGTSPLELVAPEERDRVRENLRRRLEGEIEEVQYQTVGLRKDGRRIDIELHGSRIEYAGRPAVIGSELDITERKERERDLERLKERFQAYVENASDVITVLDEEGRIRYQSPSLECVLGYEPEDLIGDHVAEYVHPEDRERVLEKFSAVIDSSEETSERAEYRFRHADGSWTWLESVGSNQRHTGIDGYIANSRDISERRAIEDERVETIDALGRIYAVTTDPELGFEEKLARLLEVGCEKIDLPYGFLTRIDVDVDADGEHAGKQTVVESQGEHELLQPGATCPLSQAYCRETIRTDGLLAIRNAVEEGWEDHPAYREFDLGAYIGGKVTVDGELYGTLCFASRSPREEGFTDTDRMLVRVMSKWASYELERHRATTRLRRQNERLEEFAGIVSHDLRNPLNVADGRLELAREACECARTREHLEDVAYAHDRMAALIDDLLTLTRDGGDAEDREPLDLADLSLDCWRNVDTAEATLVTDLDRTVRADRGRLQQLLENLFRNAVEHGGSDVSVTVGELEDGFYLEEDGPGIPEGSRTEVFDASYSTAEEGTGFGLSIVKQVVDAHGWDIRLTSGTDGGARFEITGVEFVG